MTIEFENYGRFYPTLIFLDEAISYRFEECSPYSLKECTDFIDYKMRQNPDIEGGVICDWDTGEVVATIKPDSLLNDYAQEYMEHADDCDPDWGYNEDMGFDPYMGCYTDDC